MNGPSSIAKPIPMYGWRRVTKINRPQPCVEVLLITWNPFAKRHEREPGFLGEDGKFYLYAPGPAAGIHINLPVRYWQPMPPLPATLSTDFPQDA